MHRQALPKRATQGAVAARDRLQQPEVRSFEVEHVAALWHLDFHHASRKVLTRAGAWVKPMLLGVIDDRSRLVCHLHSASNSRSSGAMPVGGSGDRSAPVGFSRRRCPLALAALFSGLIGTRRRRCGCGGTANFGLETAIQDTVSVGIGIFLHKLNNL